MSVIAARHRKQKGGTDCFADGGSKEVSAWGLNCTPVFAGRVRLREKGKDCENGTNRMQGTVTLPRSSQEQLKSFQRKGTQRRKVLVTFVRSSPSTDLLAS